MGNESERKQRVNHRVAENRPVADGGVPVVWAYPMHHWENLKNKWHTTGNENVPVITEDPTLNTRLSRNPRPRSQGEPGKGTRTRVRIMFMSVPAVQQRKHRRAAVKVGVEVQNPGVCGRWVAGVNGVDSMRREPPRPPPQTHARTHRWHTHPAWNTCKVDGARGWQWVVI